MDNLIQTPLIASYIEYWRRAIEFRGLTTRASYWWSCLAGIIVSLILWGPYYFQFLDPSWDPAKAQVPLGMTIFGLLTYIPSLTILIRRLRDTGKSWQWMFMTLIPIVGAIWLLIQLTRPSLKKEEV